MLQKSGFEHKEVNKVIWKYRQACEKEGLSEEQIKKIEKIFDDDKKRRIREKAAMRRYGIQLVSLESFVNDDPRSERIEPADPNVNVEAEVMKQIEHEMVHDCFREMNPEDVDFLLKLYAGRRGIETALANEYGLTRSEFRRKHQKLLNQFKEIFLKKFGEY